MSNGKFVDIVNRKDKVIGRVPELESDHLKKKIRRAVVVFVFDKEGRLYLQKRSQKKYRCPLHWCCSAAGLVDSGETYEEAALRELEEELGVKKEPKDLEALLKKMVKTDLTEFVKAYAVVCNGEVTPDPEEVATGKFVSLKEVKKMMAQGEKFTPFFLCLFGEVFGGEEKKAK